MPSLLWETPADEKNADLSPDGKWIAYSASAEANSDIWIKPID